MDTIDERVREAHDAGRKAAADTHSPLYILSASPYSRPDDPVLADAFNKGLRGEQLDGDKQSR